MKRAQRKVNFKKIQGAQGNSEDNNNIERRQTRNTKTTKAAADLQAGDRIDVNNEPLISKKTSEVSPFAKRVNLTRFLYKDKTDRPPEITKRETDSSDDFETPVKKIKAAPKMGQKAQPSGTAKPNTKISRKRSKQPNIKSALMRTEEMFSEIAAQHCLVDNFSPDDIQMALVISRSEVDPCNFAGVAGVSDANVDNAVDAGIIEKSDKYADEDIYRKLQKYGFRTAAKGDYANCFAAAFSTAHRRGKTKWANKFTALTLRDADVQTKKLNDKIDAMLAQQNSLHRFRNKVACVGNSTNEIYKVHSNFLLQHLKSMPDAHFFRNIESLSMTENFERFFIEELFPITHLPAGHLLKDWTVIPGRDVSPQRRKRQRLSAQEKKFENFYNQLEQESLLTGNVEKLSLAAVDSVEPIEDVSMLVMPGSQNVCDLENELDGLIEVITQTDKDNELSTEKAVEVVSEDKQRTAPCESIELTSSSDTNNFDSGSTVANTQTRCTSPDLFADSDSDCKEMVEENNLNNITTFERFSSDEARDVADLTQNAAVEKTAETKICASAESSVLCEKETKNDFLELLKCPLLMVNDMQKESMGKESNDPKESTDPAVSIDLTQSDDELCRDNDGVGDEDEENDSDCIMLSDDEINYSILKANEVNKNQTRRLTKLYSGNSSSGSSGSLSQTKENVNNFSVLEFVEDESCFAVNENGSFSRKQTFDLSGDKEPIKTHYLSMAADDTALNKITPAKSAEHLKLTSRAVDAKIFSTPACYATPTKETDISALLKAQRAEFGILESQSETFSQTPPHWQYTPVKSNTSPSKDESPLFTAADVAESEKRCSIKFSSFLQTSHDLGVQALDEFDDFDEFDRLVYGSPKKSKKASAEGVPTGLSQLLTGEISLDAPFSHSGSPRQDRLETSKKISKMETPEKYQEIVINERVYLVRKSTTPKPNFEAQSESEILKQLYEFGIKPLKRKQSIKLLEYIYNETHPVMLPAKDESSANEATIATTMQSQYSPKSTAAVITGSQSTAKTSQLTQSSTAATKFNLQDCCGATLLRFSQELFAEMRNDEEIYIFQTNVTKKTQQPLLPLHIAWFNLVCSSQELHESILMYQPIELQEVYLFLKSLGYRYDPKDLKSFFDRRCIIFRYDLTPPEKQKDRHTRKPQKKLKNSVRS